MCYRLSLTYSIFAFLSELATTTLPIFPQLLGASPPYPYWGSAP